MALLASQAACTSARMSPRNEGWDAQVAADAAAMASDATASTQAAADAAAAADGTTPARTGWQLELLLLDNATREPIQGARTALMHRAGVGRTGPDGLDQWDMEASEGAGEIEVRCPATRSSGRRILRVPYQSNGRTTRVVAHLDMSQCVEPPETSTTGNYRGFYQDEFESSYFRPCGGLPKEAAFGNDYTGGAWVEHSKSSWRQLESKLPRLGDTLKYGIYVEWTGTLIGPGAYGHMGAHAYRFEVRRITRASQVFPADCPRPQS